MKITKAQLKKLIKEAQWGNFTGGAAPLDVPVRDSGPVPKDQLRKLADIFINDMGMTPEEVLQNPEFVDAGVTDLAQLKERIMKITTRQLRRIIREAIDTKLSRHRSKGNLPDARSDEKAAARRAERRYDSKAIEIGLADVADEYDEYADPYSVAATVLASYGGDHAGRNPAEIENDIHRYLEVEKGLDPHGDEIFSIADDALTAFGKMVGGDPRDY